MILKRENNKMERFELYLEDDIEQRLDAYLASIFEQFSRTYIKKLIQDENILVNGQPKKPKYLVKKDDYFEITVPEPEYLNIQAENIKLDIIYQDDDLMIINKPKGMVVHPAPGNYSGTLVNALMYHADSLSTINGVIRPGIVHRLDKDTTGLMVVAKNDKAHQELSAQFKAHTTEKIYHAIAMGHLKELQGTVNAPIGRDSKDRKKMAVTKINSKEALTHYRVLALLKQATYVENILETGRTHQIRVHMAYLGHPLLGDTVYGLQKQKYDLQGQTLHAKTLSINQPSTGERMTFDSELPDYFKNLLEILKL